MQPSQVHSVLEGIHYAAPYLQLAVFLITILVSICIISPKKAEDRATPRKTIIWSMCLIAATYLGQAAAISVKLLTGIRGPITHDSNVYALSSFLVWVVQLLICVSSENPKWWPFYGSWFYSLAVEITLLSLFLAYVRPLNFSERAQVGFQILRIFLLVLLLFLIFVPGNIKTWQAKRDEEAAPLLGHPQEDSETTLTSKNNSNYGSTEISGNADNESIAEEILDAEAKDLKKEEEKLKRIKDRIRESGSWVAYAREFFIFLPHIWPSARWHLQLNAIGVGICILCTRALNVLVPRQLGIVVNALGQANKSAPFLELGLYILFYWASSGSGVYVLRNWLFVPLEMSARQAINTASYNHIMGLSCEFHDSKQSGELYTAMQQGRSVIDLLELLIFNLIPMVVDLVVACAYLYYLFDTYMFLIVAAAMIMFLWMSTYLTTQQASLRRRNVRHSREEHQVMYDTMGGWKTVSYFNRLPYAKDKYSSAASRNTDSRKKWLLHFYIATSIQGFALDAGLFGACFYAVYQVTYGNQSVGSFVTLLTYWGGLVGPLESLSHAYREVLSDLIDAEQLLELFQTKPSVKTGAKTLRLKEGRVTFEKVDFGYDGKKQTITDLSFEAAPGQTIALIGETGGGKSTILKLIFRFYDVKGGAVLIDGQDVRDLTLESLRECIGVVPQDPTLFNETIMSNVRFAKLDATDEEIKNACQSAAVHDKIMTFTEKYMSKVGEQGVKLSGGELQRIAIARAILKDPKIILLDEATSSVDSETEGKIQEALTKLSKGRTTFVVAHRLSTIMDADLILVIKEGRILEQGRPAELLKSKGKYYSLWCKQMGVNTEAPLTEDQAISNGADQEDGPALRISSARVPERCPKLERGDSEKDGLEHSSRPGLDESSSKGKAANDSYTKQTFRPDAPEFVPHEHNGTEDSSENASDQYNHPPLDHSHSAINLTRTENGKRTKRNKGKAKKDFEHNSKDQIDGGGEVGATQSTSKKPNDVQSTGIKEVAPNAKRSRADRRRQSKSEPANQNIPVSQGGRPNHFETMPIGSSEIQAMTSTSRQASAPGIPSAGPNKQPRSAGWPHRRVRHGPWRGRNQNKSTTSENPSTGPSRERSTNSSQLTRPTALFPNLAVGANWSNGSTDIPSESSVRFAPGS